MAYAVYNIGTTRLLKIYSTLRGAKIGLAAANRKAGYKAYEVVTEELYNEMHNQMVPVKNMMSGKEVYIRQQDVGTCCDPSTETYWSM